MSLYCSANSPKLTGATGIDDSKIMSSAWRNVKRNLAGLALLRSKKPTLEAVMTFG